MRNLSKYSGKKADSDGNHLDAFDDNLERQQVNIVDAKVAQIIIRSGYSVV